jgi:AcrR family transcriptional regulator
MPRAGLSPAAVVDAAIALLDEQGPDAVTLAAVAARTGVTTPSLYKHVRNLAELQKLISIRVLDDLTERTGAAIMGLSADDAVRAAMHAYRDFATQYPHRYLMLPQQATPDPELTAAGEQLVSVLVAVLRGYGLTGSAAIHGVRCIRAAAHGFASLEAAGGFGRPEDIDATFDHLVAMIVTGLAKSL